MRKLIIVVFLILPYKEAFSLSEMFSFPLDLKWYSTETKNFILHYHTGLKDTIPYIAALAENVRKKVIDASGLRPPKKKINIVLFSNSNIPFGFANFAPPAIYISLAPPYAESIFTPDGNWIENILSHEDTHILVIYQNCPVYTVFSSIFGTLFSANMYTPRFLQEGYATHIDNKTTNTHNIPHDFSDLKIENIVGDMPSWPFQHFHYLYGESFFSYLEKKYGTEKLSDFFKENSCSLPYLWFSTFKDVFGISFEDEIKSFIKELKFDYEKKSLAYILSEGGTFSNINKIVEDNYPKRGLSIYKDNIYFTQNENGKLYIAKYNINESRITKLIKRNSLYSLSAKDGIIAFDQIQYDKFKQLSDIWIFEEDSKKLRKITENENAAYPDISYDKRFIVYIKREIFNDKLCMKSIEDNTSTENCPFSSEKMERLYSPKFSPDSDKILLSILRKNGDHDIAVFDLAENNLTLLTQDKYIDFFPSWSDDSKYIIFSSSRDGYFNLYAYSLTEKTFSKLTRIVSGAFESQIYKEKIYFIGLSRNGFDIFSTDFTPLKIISVGKTPSPTYEQEEITLEEKNYSPPKYILPSIRLIPSFDITVFKSAIFPTLSIAKAGFLFAGADLLYKNSYGLSLFTTFEVRSGGKNTNIEIPYIPPQLGGYFAYLSRNFFPYLGLEFARFQNFGQPITYTDMVGSQITYKLVHERITQGKLSIIFPYKDFRFWLGTNTEYINAMEGLPEITNELNKEIKRKYNEDYGEGWFVEPKIGFFYRTSKRYISSFSVEDGEDIRLSAFFPLNHDLKVVLKGIFESSHKASNILILRFYTESLYVYGKVKKRMKSQTSISDKSFYEESNQPFTFLDLPKDDKSVLLRGYFPFFTDKIINFNIEPRLKLLSIWKGYWKVPLYFKTLAIFPLISVGTDLKDRFVSYGASLNLDATLGYYIPLSIRFGVFNGIGGTKNTFPFLHYDIAIKITEGELR